MLINGRFLSQPVTGVQRYAREILSAFDDLLDRRSDIRMRLLTPQLPEDAVPNLRNITHNCVGRLRGHTWEQIDLPRHVGGRVLFCPGNTAPVASLMGQAKVVVTVHDLSYLYFPDAYSTAFKLLYNQLTPLILRRGERIITVSHSERNAIVSHYPYADRRLVAIQNGGLPVGIAEQTPQETGEQSVLYVGSLSKRKNFPAMLEVAIQLARKRGTRFVFVGSVPHGLSASIAEVPGDVRSLITFRGQINDWSQLLEAYRSATCFFFPSLYEASPLPPIEAMGCGCPVIASGIPSLRERCGSAAVYCDPRDPVGMGNAIEDLLDNRAKRDELRQAGYERARRFSWIRSAEATLDAILTMEDRP